MEEIQKDTEWDVVVDNRHSMIRIMGTQDSFDSDIGKRIVVPNVSDHDCNDHYNIALFIIRKATMDEYLAFHGIEHRKNELLKMMPPPRFYQVQVLD